MDYFGASRLPAAAAQIDLKSGVLRLMLDFSLKGKGWNKRLTMIYLIAEV